MNAIILDCLKYIAIWTMTIMTVEYQADQLEEHNKTILIVSDPYCPYACSEDNAKQGYMVEIARQALEPLGYNIEYKVMPWKRVLQEAAQEKVDAVLTLELNDIETLIKGKIAVATTCQAVVTQSNDNLDWTKPDSFKGKRIGIINGYTYTGIVAKWINNKDSQSSITRVSGNNALDILLNMIDRGRIDATIADCNVGKLAAKNLGIEQNIKFHLTGFVSDMYIGVQQKRTDKETILNAIDAAMLAMKKDGRLQNLIKKYSILNF